MSEALLSDLIRADSLPSVIKEIREILYSISPGIDLSMVISAFNMTVDLYEGRFPGYQRCNTLYHDLRHTTDTIIAMARLVHGAFIAGERFSDRMVALAMITALFHDAGYILEESDYEGTGAKYTAHHVERSITFFVRFGEDLGLDPSEIEEGRKMILCTDLAATIPEIQFASKEVALLGKMLGVADLFAQMADRTYLEKLSFLYKEFKEGKVGDYTSEIDLLRKTVGFYDFTENRVKTVLGGVDRFMKHHFKERFGIDSDLYRRSILNQKNYLQQILAKPDAIDPRHFLKRKKTKSKAHRKP
jgi:hypothetical protein